MHCLEDGFCLDANLHLLFVLDTNHGFLQVDEVLLRFVEGAVHNHGEVFAHNGLGEVEDVDLTLGEGCGHGGDNAFVVDTCDGEDDLRGVLLAVWGCVPEEEVHKGTDIRIFIRPIIGYLEHIL